MVMQVDKNIILEVLNDKADLDLNNINPSDTIKNLLIRWGLPDYTAGIVYQAGTHKAPASGFIYAMKWGNYGASGKVSVNGAEVLCFQWGIYNGKDGAGVGIMAPVVENDDIVATGTGFTFYPCQGVV